MLLTDLFLVAFIGIFKVVIILLFKYIYVFTSDNELLINDAPLSYAIFFNAIVYTIACIFLHLHQIWPSIICSNLHSNKIHTLLLAIMCITYCGHDIWWLLTHFPQFVFLHLFARWYYVMFYNLTFALFSTPKVKLWLI